MYVDCNDKIREIKELISTTDKLSILIWHDVINNGGNISFTVKDIAANIKKKLDEHIFFDCNECEYHFYFSKYTLLPQKKYLTLECNCDVFDDLIRNVRYTIDNDIYGSCVNELYCIDLLKKFLCCSIHQIDEICCYKSIVISICDFVLWIIDIIIYFVKKLCHILNDNS